MNQLTKVENPLEGMVATRPGANSPAAAATDQARAIAEVQAAMVIARANPRDEKAAIDRILNACMRPRLAESAIYQYARGGSDISGPSIRLAEAIAQNWGNIEFGIRELEQRGGASQVQAFAWDLETNVRREITFSVPHERHTKRGSTRLTDPRDIYETIANNGARRVRACILAIIPGDVIEVAVEQCEVTLKAKADTSPEAQQQIVNTFNQFGVTQHQIEARIQRRLDAITPAQVVSLKKIYVSLRDGMSSPEDWFEQIEEPEGEGEQGAEPAAAKKAGGTEAAKAALQAAQDKRKPAEGKQPAADEGQTTAEAIGDELPEHSKGAAPGAEEPESDELQVEEDGTGHALPPAEEGDQEEREAGPVEELVADDDSPPARMLKQVKSEIDQVTTIKALDAVEKDWVNTHRIAYDEPVQNEIDQLINAKRKTLKGGEK